MEDREMPWTRKYGESKMTWIMMATIPHRTSGLGLRKFQADGFLFDRVYNDVMGEVHYFSLLGYVTNYVSQNLLELQI